MAAEEADHQSLAVHAGHPPQAASVGPLLPRTSGSVQGAGFLDESGRGRKGAAREAGRLPHRAAPVPEGLARGQGQVPDGRHRGKCLHEDATARRGRGRGGQEGAGGGQPQACRVRCQEVRQPRAAPAGSDPGGQHWPDAGSREVRVPQGLQVLHVRYLVDPSGDYAGDRRPVAHDPHTRAHERVDEQVPAGIPRAGERARAHSDE